MEYPSGVVIRAGRDDRLVHCTHSCKAHAREQRSLGTCVDGYADNDVHKNEHQRLINELGYLKDKFNRGGEMVTLHTLKEWLLSHISSSDKLLGEFILSQSAK